MRGLNFAVTVRYANGKETPPCKRHPLHERNFTCSTDSPEPWQRPCESHR